MVLGVGFISKKGVVFSKHGSSASFLIFVLLKLKQFKCTWYRKLIFGKDVLFIAVKEIQL